MPREVKENEFLKQNQATRFVEHSSGVLKSNIGSLFTNVTKIFVENNNILKNAENSLNFIGKTLSNIIDKNNSNILNLQIKKIVGENNVSRNNNKKDGGIKNYIKDDDPNDPVINAIIKNEKLLKSIRDNDMDFRKKSGGGLLGLLGGVGAFFVGGGLVGYLMTGKKEFLFSVAKGVTKYLGKGLSNIFNFGKLPGKIISNFTKFAKFVGRSIKSLTSLNVGNIVGMSKKVKQSFKFIKNSFKSVKSLGSLFKSVFKSTKSLASIGAKSIIGKTSKTFLKKIPVVGGILGLIFGIQRFKKNDWVGGLLEIGSGVASIVPGIGTALGIAIDSFLLFRDFRGVDMTPNDEKPKKSVNLSFIKNLPGIGTIWHMIDGFKLIHDGKNVEGLKTMMRGLTTIFPFGGFMFDGITSFIESVSKNGLINTVSSWFGMMGANTPHNESYRSGDVGVYSFGNERGGDAKINRSRNSVGIKQFDVKNWYKRTDNEKDYGFYPLNDKYKNFNKNEQKYDGIRLFKPWNPDFEGLQPNMKNNFINMAKEYYFRTGENIQVNSGKRYGGGSSTHDYGWAIDINSNDANNLERMNLLQKYGFHRPLLNWHVKKEPWHVEPYPGENIYGPRDTINNDYRRNNLMNNKSRPEQSGDKINVPTGIKDLKRDDNKPIHVMLSESDIQKIIVGFGEQLKRNKPDTIISNNQYVGGRNL